MENYFSGPDPEMVKDANRWLKLKQLVGSVEDGGGNKVSLFWDDATETPVIKVNRQEFSGEHETFESILDSI